METIKFNLKNLFKGLKSWGNLGLNFWKLSILWICHWNGFYEQIDGELQIISKFFGLKGQIDKLLRFWQILSDILTPTPRFSTRLQRLRNYYCWMVEKNFISSNEMKLWKSVLKTTKNQ